MVRIDPEAVSVLRPLVRASLVGVLCPLCGTVHHHHWLNRHPDPGMKDPRCRPRGTAPYYVPAPVTPTLWQAHSEVQAAMAVLAGFTVPTAPDDRSGLLALILACRAVQDAVADVERLVTDRPLFALSE